MESGGPEEAEGIAATVVKDFAEESELPSVLEALVRVHQKYSNRRNRNAARIKFVNKRFGAEKFRALFEEEFARVKQLPTRPWQKLAWRKGDMNLPAPTTPGGVVALGLDMDLGHQGAGSVQEQHLARAGRGGHRLGHAVGREDDRPVVGTFIQLLDEHCAHRLQAVDHMAVVHDLVAHIDRGAVLLDGALDDLDGPVDPGAEAARGRQSHGDGAAFGRGGRHVGVHGRQPSPSRFDPPRRRRRKGGDSHIMESDASSRRPCG